MYNPILVVDEYDKPIGETEKLEAVKQGMYRRIVRVFLFDNEGHMLIQKRSAHVLLPLLWDQAVGGHCDATDRTYRDTALRETKEELGISSVSLIEIEKSQKVGTTFEGIFKGVVNRDVSIDFDKKEVAEVAWVSIESFEQDSAVSKEKYVAGFLRSWHMNKQKLLA